MERCSVDQLTSRWADGWIDLHTIVHSSDRREVQLEVEYLEYPSDSVKSTWLYNRAVFPVMVDLVVFEDVVSLETSVDAAERMLWLSTVNADHENSVTFYGSQGHIRIFTLNPTCRVTSRLSGEDAVVRTLFGIQLQTPQRRVHRSNPDQPTR